MLTNDDVQKLLTAFKTVFATREEIDTRFEEVNAKIDSLMTSVDAYAKKADTYFQEMVMLSHKVDKLEGWIHQIAEKAGVVLKQTI